jgi:hypothetical protein
MLECPELDERKLELMFLWKVLLVGELSRDGSDPGPDMLLLKTPLLNSFPVPPGTRKLPAAYMYSVKLAEQVGFRGS